MPPIGILGGMGTVATRHLMQKIIEMSKAKKDQDFPEFILYNYPQIPDRTEAILNNSKKPAKFLVKGLKKLEAAGASPLIMDCNAAYAFNKEIAGKIKTRTISLVDETAKRLAKKRPHAKKIGIMATTGTLKAKLYEKSLAKYANCREFVYPNQKEIMEIIYGKKGIKANNKKQSKKISKILSGLAKKGAQAVIVGCTDLSVLISEKNSKPAIIDSTTTLAGIIIKNGKRQNRKAGH